MKARKANSSLGTHRIARICHVTPPTVARWIGQKKLPAFTTGGGHRRVLEADLTAFLRQHDIPVPPHLSAANRPVALIVDDESAARRVVALCLRAVCPEAEVHEAGDGFAAGRQTALLRPSLVVLDLRLPGVDGLQVCRTIRTDPHLRLTKILAVSAFDLPGSGDRAREAGADDFLAKPFDLDDLKRVLALLLGVRA